jgi:ribosomal protein S18 acetylase RimI-like enzyme
MCSQGSILGTTHHGMDKSRKLDIQPLKEGQIESLVRLVEPGFPPAWRLNKTNLYRAVESSSIKLAAMVNQRAVGYILAQYEDDSIHVARLAIAPEFQQQGIGSILMNELEQIGKNLNGSEYTLNTYSGNTSAIQFYEKLGFIITNQSFPVYGYTARSKTDI